MHAELRTVRHQRPVALGLGPSSGFVQANKGSKGAMETSPTGGKFCSGSLISSNLFLTAGHCVDASAVGEFVSSGRSRPARRSRRCRAGSARPRTLATAR